MCRGPDFGRSRQHQPADSRCCKGTIRLDARQGIDHHRRATDITAQVYEILFRIFPMRAAGADDRLVVDICQQRFLVIISRPRVS